MNRNRGVSRVILSIALAITALSCQTHLQQKCFELPPAAAPLASSSIIAEYFINTMWMSVTPARAYVRYLFLRSDGSFCYSETQATSDFKYDGTDTWRLEEGYLLIVWSNGFATEKYPINGMPGKVLKGLKTSMKWQGELPVVLFRITDK